MQRQTRKGILTGLMLAILLTACAGVTAIGAGCETYRDFRVRMPDPEGVPRDFIDWFNQLDVAMLEACNLRTVGIRMPWR